MTGFSTLESAGDIEVKLRRKAKKAENDKNRKSRYFVPAVKLFGGRLIDYVEESGHGVPRIVTSCVRTINLHGFYHQGIFRVPGVQTDLQMLQQAYERGEDPLADSNNKLTFDINSIAGLLKMYLRKLEEKLIPDAVFESVNDASTIDDETLRVEKLKIIMKNIPDSVLIVMRYLFHFLNQ